MMHRTAAARLPVPPSRAGPSPMIQIVMTMLVMTILALAIAATAGAQTALPQRRDSLVVASVPPADSGTPTADSATATAATKTAAAIPKWFDEIDVDAFVSTA